ncbi:AzlD domain-containing protein [Phaeobacter porticola]|uniref:Branched-chain amino acid transport protein (AzlD) n=1 Tax=Phaeobacter porticola TaxID=1844006 RepID=A0A1L3I9T2_9RHOB|nr:AzlD domain-containing protein [Phaeobacter porticola]APG48927.1 Branched-chain amino acid transport protein (AzlD) [Phaeobacter porticola]
MTYEQWGMILALAVAAFGIRLLGLVAGDRLQQSRFASLLTELPGLIVISLVAASLANQPPLTWGAAVIALGIALLTNDVIWTMIGGVLGYAVLSYVII